MKRQTYTCISFVPLVLMIVLLSSCGFSKIGTIPSGTPDHGNGTPSILPSPSPTVDTAIPAPAGSLDGSTYAFVRNGQLWVALRGADPIQITHFLYTDLTNVFWHQPIWSPDDRYLAFIVNAIGDGLGGGGCPTPQYGATGALYVLNTNSMQLTKITFPGENQSGNAKFPAHDLWQYMFWQDPTHLLLWHTGLSVPGQTGTNTAGLYSYELPSAKLTELTPQTNLGTGNNGSSILSMRYSAGQLFYLQADGNQLAIYRYALAHPEIPGSKIVTVVEKGWCDVQNGAAPLILPGWDISADGQQLVAQTLIEAGATKGQGTILNLNLTTGAMKQLIIQANPADTTLTWGPDNQTIVGNGPYSLTLTNPDIQPYTPGNFSEPRQVSWRSKTEFVVSMPQRFSITDTYNVYLYRTGNPQGLLLLKDARNFVWG